MPRVKVFDETNKPTKEVYLRLIEEGDLVRLVVVDSLGQRRLASSLLTISSSGDLKRSINVNKDFGFDLDEVGKLHLDR